MPGALAKREVSANQEAKLCLKAIPSISSGLMIINQNTPITHKTLRLIPCSYRRYFSFSSIS